MNQIWQDTLTAFRTFTFSSWAHNTIKAMPDTVWQLRGLYALIIILLLVAGIVVSFLKLYPPYKARWQIFCFTNAVIAAILFFFRIQNLPFIGADILRLLHEATMVAWIALILTYRFTTYYEELRAQDIAARRLKYLPNQKRKTA